MEIIPTEDLVPSFRCLHQTKINMKGMCISHSSLIQCFDYTIAVIQRNRVEGTWPAQSHPQHYRCLCPAAAAAAAGRGGGDRSWARH